MSTWKSHIIPGANETGTCRHLPGLFSIASIAALIRIGHTVLKDFSKNKKVNLNAQNNLNHNQ